MKHGGITEKETSTSDTEESNHREDHNKERDSLGLVSEERSNGKNEELNSKRAHLPRAPNKENGSNQDKARLKKLELAHGHEIVHTNGADRHENANDEENGGNNREANFREGGVISHDLDRKTRQDRRDVSNTPIT